MGPVTDHARISYSCPCRQARLIAVRVWRDGKAFVAFFAAADCQGVHRGEPVQRCPGCGRDLRGVTWDAFSDEVFSGH